MAQQYKRHQVADHPVTLSEQLRSFFLGHAAFTAKSACKALKIHASLARKIKESTALGFVGSVDLIVGGNGAQLQEHRPQDALRSGQRILDERRYI